MDSARTVRIAPIAVRVSVPRLPLLQRHPQLHRLRTSPPVLPAHLPLAPLPLLVQAWVKPHWSSSSSEV